MVAHFPSRSIRASTADCLPGPAACERLLAKPLFIGVDVSKAWVDIADTDGRRKPVANEVAAIAAAFTGPWSTCATWSTCANIVCEATGGYEGALMRVASSLCPCAGCIPIAPANRARAFAQATGRLAKTPAGSPRPTSSMRKCSPNWPPSPSMSRQSPCPAHKPRNWPPW
jgi:hypothetical protein